MLQWTTVVGVLTWTVAGECQGDCDSPSNMFLQTAHHHLREEKYQWPSGRGRYPFFAVSDNNGPFHLNDSLAWSWHHPDGRFATLTYGAVIDNDLNVYLSCADGMRKFDKDGNMLWEHICMPANFMNAPVIWEGLVYASDTFGGVRALDMKDGKRVWYANVSSSIGQDNGFNMVHQGVVIAAADHTKDSPQGDANRFVKGLNASTGELLWSYEPDMPLWNFLALFPDDDSMVFQDMAGTAYRLTLKGELMWKAGGVPKTWTDGSAALGPSGLVYTVANNHNDTDMLHMAQPATAPGTVSAFDVTDGTLKWQATTPRPPNNAPAVGKVYGWEGLSVVVPVCQQVLPGATCDVNVYDANTGEPRWEEPRNPWILLVLNRMKQAAPEVSVGYRNTQAYIQVFHGPTQNTLMQAGDLEGMVQRKLKFNDRDLCLPNGWSAPAITADGTVYVGSETGPVFALRDADGDGRVLGDAEVQFYETKAAFSGSSSPALAPQMMAVASCDSLFVFKG